MKHLVEELMTPEEVAARMKIKTRTLRAWRAAQKGPQALRLGPDGNLIRYRAQDVQEWLNQNLVEA